MRAGPELYPRLPAPPLLRYRRTRPVTAGRVAAAARHLPLIAAIVLAATPCHAVQAQAPIPAPPPGRIVGIVSELATGAPVRAEIEIAGRPSIRSDSTGRFQFLGVTHGRIVLRARALGFHAVTTELDVTPADSATPVAVQLTRLAPILAAVRTEARTPEREQFDETLLSSTLSVRGRELSSLPVVGERDLLRVVAFLPGVGARNDFSASFNVRGGEADQNLVLLDGIPIYNPFHLGGLFGTFIDAAVGDVELTTAGFPAAYGGRLSSVLQVRSAEETRSGVHGTTDVSLLSSSARLAGSLGNGRTSWSIAGRRTYADKVISLIHGANDFPYHFQDAQLHLRSLVPGGGTVAVSAYAGRDVLDRAPASGTGAGMGPPAIGIDFDWGNAVAGLSHTQPLGANASVVNQLSVSTFHTNFSVHAESLSLAQRMRESRLAGRLMHGVGAHRYTIGYELSGLRSRYRELLRASDFSPFPDALATDGDTTMYQDGVVGALFADDVWQVGERLTLRPGVRLERVGAAGWQELSPRFAAKYLVTRDFALTATAGRFAQWTRAVRNEDLPLRLFDLWVTSDATVPVSTATHVVLGAEQWFSPSRFLRVEGYRKEYADLAEPASTIDPRVRPSLLRTFDGASWGLDVFARQLQHGWVGGWLSYGYGVSWRERDGFRYFAAHDRRHSGNLVLTLAPGNSYTFGLHAGASTGTPYTGWAGRMSRWQYDPVLRQWGLAPAMNANDLVHGTRNGERLPFYSRVDVSIERRIEMGWATLRPMFSLVNAFNRRNVLLFAMDEQAAPPRVVSYSQFPMLPSLGLRAEF